MASKSQLQKKGAEYRALLLLLNTLCCVDLYRSFVHRAVMSPRLTMNAPAADERQQGNDIYEYAATCHVSRLCRDQIVVLTISEVACSSVYTQCDMSYSAVRL